MPKNNTITNTSYNTLKNTIVTSCKNTSLQENLEKCFINYLKKRGYVVSKKNEQLETE